MSIKEGLASQDAMAIADAKVTLTYKLVKHAPVRTEDEELFVEDINRAEMEERYSLLRRNFTDFLQIHESYIYYRLSML